jgi:hypothetical protein
MTLTAERAAVTLRGPATLVASIPTLLGFVPDQSVIAVWLKDGTILVTQRADLDPCLADPNSFFAPMRKHQPDELILVIWSDRSPDEDPQFFDEKVEAFVEYAKADVEVRDALWVHRGAWGSLVCNDPACCPPGGREIDYSLAPELGKEAPLSHRETLLSECKPGGTTLMKPLDPHGIEGWRDKSIDRLLEVWAEDGFESDKHLTRAGRALHDVRVRDTILWYATTSLSPEEMSRAYDLVSCVARAMHPSDAAPACTIAAILAWQSGDGARANIALDYALVSDPGYSLAQLVQHSLSVGLPPSAWQDSMSGLTFDDVRKGKK